MLHKVKVCCGLQHVHKECYSAELCGGSRIEGSSTPPCRFGTTCLGSRIQMMNGPLQGRLFPSSSRLGLPSPRCPDCRQDQRQSHTLQLKNRIIETFCLMPTWAGSCRLAARLSLPESQVTCSMSLIGASSISLQVGILKPCNPCTCSHSRQGLPFRLWPDKYHQIAVIKEFNFRYQKPEGRAQEPHRKQLR